MLLAAGIERPRLLHACIEEPFQCGHCCDQKQRELTIILGSSMPGNGACCLPIINK